jgi:Holliday junction DNA helicase RuvA
MSVSGIGPKSALGILSALPVADLASAIQSGDVEKLETVPGIGKKSAGRLVLELKDKLIKIHPGLMATVDQSIAGSDDVFDDALSALTNLGYRATDAKDALKTVRKSPAQPLSLQELIRETLKHLAKA